jgi:hypothetical protein
MGCILLFVILLFVYFRQGSTTRSRQISHYFKTCFTIIVKVIRRVPEVWTIGPVYSLNIPPFLCLSHNVGKTGSCKTQSIQYLCTKTRAVDNIIDGWPCNAGHREGRLIVQQQCNATPFRHRGFNRCYYLHSNSVAENSNQKTRRGSFFFFCVLPVPRRKMRMWPLSIFHRLGGHIPTSGKVHAWYNVFL